MQTTLLGLAIAFIVALVAALIGPYFVDWNQFRPQFEAEATRIIGAPVRVGGELDARLLPTPTLRLRSVTVGGPNDLGKIHADKLDVEFSLGELMRGDWRADELTIDGLAVDLGLDPQGRIDLPETSGAFDLGSLSIARLNLNGRIALHDAASRSTLELSDIAFSGDVRSLAGSLRGGGDFTVRGTRYPFRVSSGQGPDGNGTRIHLSIDPGDRPLSADLDGVLDFVSRAPRFQGALTLAVAAQPKASAEKDAPTPWRISTKVKADHAKAQLDQIEASYGTGDRALKFAGSGDIRFGVSPLLHAVLAARRLDADRLIAPDNGKDNAAAPPPQWLPVLRKALAVLPYPPVATRIEASAEQIMLGGRPLQNLSAAIHGDATSWSIDRLDLRAPGSTQVSLTAADAPAAAPGSFSGTLDVDSSDPNALAAWLQGRSDAAFHNQQPLRLRGKVGVSPDRVSVEAMRAEVGGSTVEGSVAFADPSAGPSRIDATLKADRLDLDATMAQLRSLAGPQAEWPQEAAISLDVGRAVSEGQDLQPFAVKVSYDPKVVTLQRLKLGEANGLALEGSGHFDRKAATGTLSLNASAASLDEIGALVAPLAPALTSRVDAIGAAPGPAHLGLTLSIGDTPERSGRASARATLDLDSPGLKGVTTVTAQPELAALRGFDLQKLRHSQIDLETRLSAVQGNYLLALLGLDRAVAAGEGAVRFEGSATGVWGSPLRLNAKISGAGIDADASGTADPWAKSPDASVDLRARSVNLAPLFGLKPSDSMMANTRLFARLSVADNKLTVDDLDGLTGGSRLRGHLSLTLDDVREVEGEVGLDALNLAPVFAVAIGATGRSASDPLGGGLLKGWHGRIVFQALRADLPGGVELRPLSGTVKGDGQSLSFDALKGGIGGGEVTASIDERPGGDGIALSARLNLAGVQGAALRYRGLRMPAGRASGQMTLATQGRSVAALVGALSGSGTLTLEPAKIQGLDPQAFDVAIRDSDRGQAMNDAKLRQIVEPVLSAGTLPVASAQIPFTIRDGRLRVDATTLASANARAIVSGGYDIPADQADIRVSLTSTDVGSADNRPEIRLFATGSPDALHSSLDVSGFSSWLAVRAIDRETRRLDSIERGEPVPQRPSVAAPATAALPPANADTNPLEQPRADITVPGHGPRRAPSRPRPAASALQPTVGQQLAPLPPPIVVRPAPHPIRPKPRPPMVLTPAAPNQ